MTFLTYYNLVRLEGFEPPISKFVALHSIQLNYRRKLYLHYKSIFSKNQLLFFIFKGNSENITISFIICIYSFGFIIICTSSNCSSVTTDGALIKRSLAFLFFGNAIISLIFCELAISITILSTPGAAPA